MSCSADSYACSDVGLLLPFINESTWPKSGRAVLYMLGLLYCFLGVSIIADIFMRAIEVITSRTSTLRLPDPASSTGYREVEVRVWNNTVANLSLMALGSSAPEILLSVIEIVGNDFRAGDLGPGTIVGSAAFNLLVITGVCVIAIGKGETRRIKSMKVFAVTALFSVLAYVWLLVVLVLVSPDFVELWEAVLTFLFFPLLVVLAYLADKDHCRSVGDKEGEEVGEIGIGKENIVTGNKAAMEIVTDILRKIGKRSDVTEEDEAKVAAAMLSRGTSHDRGWYRINAIRSLTGGAKLMPGVNTKQAEILRSLIEGEDVGSTLSLLSESTENAVVQWAAPAVAVLERDGSVSLILMRTGNTENRVLVRVETIDGTAESGSDYEPLKETLVLEPGETSRKVEVKIVDDNEWEPDEVFFVKLTVQDEQQQCVIGTRAICQVTIVNDDQPGTIELAESSMVVKESVGVAQIPVCRRNGADGRVSVQWKARDMTAVHGRDYDTNQGTLVFEHGQLTKTIDIGIMDDREFEKDEHFEVALLSCDVEGAELGSTTRTIVTILNDDEFKGLVSRVVNLTNSNMDLVRLHTATWGQQITEALNVNGGDLDTATPIDCLMHFLTFGWKVMFALVPPPHIWGGWLSFLVSLAFIGLLTTFINDLAATFGCLVGLKDSVTAITLVALGTSLPDLFASKQAAVQEATADNSIGNVTGSNSVNVFMGLGVSWVVAALYWSAKGKTFEVPAGTLSFSVMLYAVCACVALAFLVLRRSVSSLGGAELGGSTPVKWMTFVFFLALWLLYIVLSIMQAYNFISVNF